MNSLPLDHLGDTAHREKRQVAVWSLAAAVGLTGIKLIAGWRTNSLGILSEAAHSGLDLVAALITLWAVRISAQPADRDHTYGHGKFENLSAFLETLLLLATCFWVIFEALRRLFLSQHSEVNANVWAFAVVLISIAVDYTRSRALRRAAEKYDSQALEADALHFATDIWSSCVVLLGLLGVLAADRLGLAWLKKADSAAALGVALIVIHSASSWGKKSIDELLDRVPQNLQEQVTAAAAAVPGVREVRQVRVRRSGPAVFTDVMISVDHAEAFEGAHDIADRAESAVRSLLPTADVMVHVEPVAGQHEEASKTIRLLAARQGLGAHAVRIYERDGHRLLEVHLEVDGHLRLEEAHQQATQFEQAVHQALPQVDEIVTHIEPSGDAAAVRPAEAVGEGRIGRLLKEFVAAHPLLRDPHEISVRMSDGELAVSCHCILDPDMTIMAAHGLTVEMEQYLRGRVTNLGRVLIHVEPPDPATGGCPNAAGRDGR